MELKGSNTKTKVFRSKREIERLLMEHAQSGLSVKAFCAGLDIASGPFYNGKGKYAKGNVSMKKAGFAPIEIVPSASSGLFADVGCIKLFADVGCIKIYQPVSAAYLKEWLA